MPRLTCTLSLSTLLLLTFLCSCRSGRPTYIITAPKRLLTRHNMTFSVSLLDGNQDPLKITVSLSKNNMSLRHAEGTFHTGTIGRMILPAEDLPKGHYELAVEGYEGQKLLFSNRSTLEIILESVSAMIQTDKAMYKAGQIVKIRSICIYTDLKPYLGKINIIISSPQGSVIQQWLDLEPTLGVASKEFQLSANSPQGDWEIQVAFNEVKQRKTFTVAEYVLSRFEVSINTSTVYFPIDRSDITGTITGRYLYGKPVKGNVTVTLSLPIYSETLTKTYEMDGTADFAFLFSELHEFVLGIFGTFLGFDDVFVPNKTLKENALENALSLIMHQVHQVTITATVSESHTGVTQSTAINISISLSKYKLKVLDYQKILKPPQNYTAYVQLTRFDHQKLSVQDRKNSFIAEITQAKNPLETSDTSDISLNTINITTPESGLVQIQFPLLPNIVSLSIKATFESAVVVIEVGSNQKAPAIYLHVLRPVVKVGLPFEFSTESSDSSKEFTYQVTSKGQPVAIGKSNLTRVQITPDISWAPLAHLIVYYIKDGLVVSDTVDLNVEGIFANKVSLSWSKDQTKPADDVSLSISTNEVNSFIGLLVVDKKAQVLKGGNDITEEMVNQALKAAVEEYVAEDKIDKNVFQSIGLMVLTDAYFPPSEPIFLMAFDGNVEFRTTSQTVELEEPEDRRVRTYFPETWIWLDLLTGLNSEISIQRTVPDSLTTWTANAFAISEHQGLQLATVPAQLEVFKSFFLELNLPYSVTRGEQLILEISIFNYLEQTQEVQVDVELGDFFDLTSVLSENTAPSSKTGSVRSQEAHVFYFPVTTKVLGKVPVTVKATTTVAFDAVTKHILVKAEGIEQSFSKAFLVAPKANEQLWTEAIQFSFPENVVEGSQRAHVTVIGDILGPSINGLEDLLQMPYGCGEQNMIRFAPNIYILQYLTAKNQVTEEMEAKAKSYMIQGYQRELTYQRTDGSFSAFGNSDSSGSTWLSAFVLRCFLQAEEFIYIDKAVLNNVTSWIIKRQNKSGEFLEPGRVIHTELQGGQNGPVALTAYVLTALLEDEKYKDSALDQVSGAVSYLEGKLHDGISSNYTLSLTAYALTLAKSKFATEALNELNQRADKQAGVKFWSSPVSRPSFWWGQKTLSSDIEVAAYALLSHLRQERLSEGIPIMQWLSQRRNHLGGFSSTQDTVIALQALSQFAAQNIVPTTDLVVSVNGPGLTVPATFTISSANMLVLQAVQIGIEQPLQVTVTAKGQGMAIVQLNVLFNLESKIASKGKRMLESEEAFDLVLDVSDNKDDLNHLTLTICTRFKGEGNVSSTGMVLMQVGMLSGFVPEINSIQTDDLIKKVEFEDGAVSLYFDSLNETEVCVIIPVMRDSKVANAQDAVVIIFEYYKIERRAVRTYNSEVMSGTNFCNFCSPDCSMCRSGNSPVTTSIAARPIQGDQFALLLCLISIYLSLT
ncbi:CD109 antigen [Leucoraja erinacea]|uniref:CD109 antigen n=1 Tax=Leucoraja erinaceus TaxID=7782 RepID=UPI002454DEE4|nr:CD109 antigen [Leucoraja erinacea]